MSSPVLTLLLITGSDASHAVAAQLRSWSDDGLLVPFVIAELGDITGLPGPAPTIRGRLVDGDGPPQVCDVLRLIAEGSWQHVVVVALFDLNAVSARVAEPHLLAAAVADELLDAMPMESDLRRSGPRRLTAVRLFAPSSDAGSFPTAWAEYDRAWAQSLVLSPEDRQGPASIADHVRWPGNYASHVAGAVAALGGLWFGFGMPGLPHPPHSTDGSGPPEAAVQVIRVQSRVAAAVAPLEPITRHAIAVAEGRRDTPPGTRRGLRTVGHASGRVLGRKAYLALREHPSQTLRYQPLPPPPAEKDVEIAGAELFDSYWRFVFGRRRSERRGTGTFRGALWEPITAPMIALRRRTDEMVHTLFQGEQTGRRFRTAPDLPHEMAQDWIQRWERASDASALRDRPFDPEADAVFWSQMRDWTLGLIDGQRPDVDPERTEVVDVIADRDLVVPAPEAEVIGEATSQLLAAQSPISPYGVHATALLAEELERALQPEALHGAASPGEAGEPPAPRQAPAEPERRQQARVWIACGAIALMLGAFVLGSGDTTGGSLLAALGAVGVVVGAVLARRGKGAAEASVEAPLTLGADPYLGQWGADGHPALIDRQLLQESDPGVLSQLTDDSARLRQWLDRYTRTVLGRLSADLADDIARAADDGESYRRQFADLERPDFGVLAKRRKAWLWWFWICLLGYLAGLYAGLRFYRWLPDFTFTFPWDWQIQKEQIAAAAWAAFTAAVLVFGIRALVRYYKAFARSRHALRGHALLCSLLIHKRDHAESERARLVHINERYTKWAEAYAWVIRDPFPDNGVEADDEGVDSATDSAVAMDVEARADAEQPVTASDDDGEPAAVPDSIQQPAAAGQAAPQEPPSAAAADSGHPPQDEMPAALGTQIGRVEITQDFEDDELRNAVTAAASRGFLHDVFLSLVRHAFDAYSITGDDIVREMDRDGRSSTSYLGLFLRELQSGECRQAAQDELGEKLAQHRARDAQTLGSGFSSMHLMKGYPGSVATFLDAVAVPASSMRKSIFGALAQVDVQHQISYGRLWTHAAGESGQASGQPLFITRLPVLPDPERVQMEAIRVDATPAVHPGRLTCFSGPAPQAQVLRRTLDDAESGLV